LSALLALNDLLLWLQPDATGGGAGEGSPEGASPSGGCATQAGLLLVMMLIFYFLLIRPQQKRQKEQDEMLRALRKGMVVRTTGGIRGEIFSIDDREAVLLVSDRVKINVLRANVAGVEPSAEEIEQAKKAKEDKKKGAKDDAADAKKKAARDDDGDDGAAEDEDDED